MTETANPYQAPAAEVTTQADGYNEMPLFKVNQCRIGRLRYMTRGFVSALATYPILGIGAWLLIIEPVLGGIALAIGYIALLIYTGILVVQRMHDLNKSGWMGLLLIVPIVNFFFIFYILCFPGSDGANNHGNPPPPNKWYHYVVGLSMPVLFVAGIVAAVALPAYFDYSQLSGGSGDFQIENFE